MNESFEISLKRERAAVQKLATENDRLRQDVKVLNHSRVEAERRMDQLVDVNSRMKIMLTSQLKSEEVTDELINMQAKHSEEMAQIQEDMESKV